MDEFEKSVEDIYRALDGKVEKDTIRAELRKWLTNFQVTMSEAKRSIVSKLGGNIKNLPRNEKKIENLMPNEGRVDVRVKVISINSREIEVDGSKRIMYYGIVGDETGTIPFTAWRLDVKLNKGDCIEIKNAYTREWQGQTKLVIGNNTDVKLLPPNSVEVKMNIKPAKIIELHPGMGIVEVIGKIMDVEKREINVDGVPREVYSGIITDDTGEIPFTSWDIEVKKGDILRISGGYVSTFRKMPQLVFDTRATIKKEDIKFELKKMPISIESLEGRGGFNVLVEGVIIDIKDGSGLIYRCPECGRVLTSTMCPEHGRVTPKPDLRIKAILDDGSGAVMCIFNREQTENILGFGMEEAMKKVQGNLGNPTIIKEIVEDKMIAKPMQVRGNVISDEKYGLRMLVRDYNFLNLEDIAKKAEKMLEEMGW